MYCYGNGYRQNVAPVGDLCVAGNDIGLSIMSIVRRRKKLYEKSILLCTVDNADLHAGPWGAE